MEQLLKMISLNLGNPRQQLVSGRVASGNGSTDYTLGKRGMANQGSYTCRTCRFSNQSQMLIDETKSLFHGIVADKSDVINNPFKVRECFPNRYANCYAVGNCVNARRADCGVSLPRLCHCRRALSANAHNASVRRVC